MTLEQHPTDPDKLVFRAVRPAFPTGNGMSLREAAQQALAVLNDDVRRCNLLLLDKITKDLRVALAEDAMQRLTDVQQEIEAALQSAGTAQTDIKPDRDTVIRLAREAGFAVNEKSQQHQPNCIWHTHYMVDDLLARFAALVAAHTREECAKVCDLVAREIDDTNGTATYCAAAIRSKK